ncbi:MAG: hypothetical protein ACT4OT_08115 [Acidobacteriota bacterium]
MRKRVKLLVSASAIAIAIGAIFLAEKPRPASGQVADYNDFYLYQLNVNCTDSGLVTKIFTVQGTGKMGTHVTCAGRCWGRMTTFAQAVAGLPAKVSEAFSAKIDEYDADLAARRQNWSLAACAGKAKPPPKKNCEKPTPWFDGVSPGAGCKNRQLRKLSTMVKVLSFCECVDNPFLLTT